MAKTLIAFFSRADENYFGGAMRYVKIGNTEIIVNDMKERYDQMARDELPEEEYQKVQHLLEIRTHTTE